MGNLTVSDKYGIAAAISLLILAAVNISALMLIVSVLGMLAGFWVFRQGEVRRVAFVAFIGFVLAGVFAVITLVR